MRSVFNFNPGPAILPEPVLESTSKAILSFANTGMSIMEISHRSKDFDALLGETQSLISEIMGIPENYKVLFLQGGASLQFAQIPINLLPAGKTADYIDTGNFSKNAIKEAQKLGNVNIAASTKDDKYTRIPEQGELKLTPGAAYVHITSNNTIEGSQWKTFPETGDVPLIADMSSDILSKAIDVSKFGLIYAGAQKNMGPAGVTIVIIRKDLADLCPDNVPNILQYATQIKNDSCYNTCPVTAIFVVHEVMKWLKDMGGLKEMEKLNEKKAAMVYDVLDNSDGFYKGGVQKPYRSLMNVTFRLPSEELEEAFVSQAGKKNLKGLKGHRSVGGIRASIYNAFPIEGVQALVDFMADFQKANK
ncbi:MAG TPA: 3-phosphoserine/phosphohydroxythreonine transaminase [Deltaproteobacteria bacterium]|nr:3-phosphoserine/phosphohydroxythreonine transaminase [Deltaproteobacteria bacterium]HOI08222.1 3-phosphoserine/phosphohydroxythreonine transaminase [Deltaproteobacteria bacterium]